MAGPRLDSTGGGRRGSVMIIVLWAIVLGALVTSSVQLFSFRQSSLGRESVHRVRARWAARAGLENAIASMAFNTENPLPDDAFALGRDLVYYAFADLPGASYDILHHVDGVDYAGPRDEHSKLNINRADTQALNLLDDITPDVVSAIMDWMDEDDEPRPLGADRDYYLGLLNPYEPRNGPYRTLAELELVAGIWPRHMRGEDWNLNGRKDPNEDDGSVSFPIDEPDRYLDAEWSAILTAYSVDGGATDSGLPRIYLRRADPLELQERLGVDEEQAQALIAYARNPDNSLEQLIVTPIGNIDGNGQVAAAELNPAAALDDDQLRMVLAECSVRPLFDRRPGKINLNTASEDFIRDLLVSSGFEEGFADELIYIRNSRPEGITSILDLYGIPDTSPEMVQRLAERFTVRSNVYTVRAKGRSEASGVEVEIIAVVDRSTVPVRILEYREQ